MFLAEKRLFFYICVNITINAVIATYFLSQLRDALTLFQPRVM